MTYLDTLLFGYYPYVALSVFLLGSLVRFDREQYSWKTDSSQLLRAGQLRWGSNLFHIGVLFLFFGHFFGLLTPHAVYEHFVTPADKQLGAMISGGIAGLAAFIGITMLLHRRLTDPRILANSRSADIFIAVLLWLQLFLGLISIAVSAQHLDGGLMMAFGEWAQHIATFRAGAAAFLAEAGVIFKLHIFLGLTMFLVFPFTRLAHVWSGFALVTYLTRSYQVVRSRRISAGR
jgi:nitrate reductase gamma subunit